MLAWGEGICLFHLGAWGEDPLSPSLVPSLGFLVAVGGSLSGMSLQEPWVCSGCSVAQVHGVRLTSDQSNTLL